MLVRAGSIHDLPEPMRRRLRLRYKFGGRVGDGRPACRIEVSHLPNMAIRSGCVWNHSAVSSMP